MNRKIKWAAPIAALTIAAAVAVPAHALDGSDGRFGIGKGRYDHFKPDPRHRDFGTEWKTVQGTHWQGDTVDLIGGGTRVAGPNSLVSVGGTTYFIWPNAHGVGTS